MDFRKMLLETMEERPFQAFGKPEELDQAVSELESMFPPDEVYERELKQLFGGEIPSIGVESPFDRWKCARCVAINMGLSAAITAACVALAPSIASSGAAASYIAAKFGITPTVAAAAIGGLKGAALSKLLCEGVC
ncbi:hypothetical protein [Desulfomonile tiedjei]|uniref:Uncharacterized protein n=1 Tax=Desulfomonile tiedjei (strain ATCC 49306 / DSM 6799 / DCB-1) TaxID=706587 RepID=I4C6E6_DESTA|nr:hypothetical protein [Desulfomonile tiedjei]AFM25137.1 hypothetical protein Desti_2455 [Desulfomonile tiedjei DSM 6799]